MTDDRDAPSGGSSGDRVRPRRTARWPTYQDGTGPFDDMVHAAVDEVLRSGRLFRYDSRPIAETAAGQLEAALARYLDTPHVLAVSSGTAALALALMALELPAGSSVACPAFGFPATASAVILAGHRPFLVAVDSNLHFDVTDLERRWSERIRAVIVVHMRGFASDVPGIVRFASDRGVSVIEDAVPAFGVKLRGRHVGTFGVAGCFSTQSDKVLNTGEGGFLITADSRVYERAVLRSGAFEGSFVKHLPELAEVASEYALPLFNFRLDELRAAAALAQIGEVDGRVRRLGDNYEYVATALARVPGIRVREPVAPGARLGDAVVFFADDGDGDALAEAISNQGIPARSFGSSRQPNVRAFWHWEFAGASAQARDAPEPYLQATVSALRASVDVPLSPRLTIADLDDLIAAVHNASVSRRAERRKDGE